MPEIFNGLPLAPDAAFDSRYNDHKPICLEKTRIELLQEMEQWILNPDGEYIYWLSGSAGTGKSTIARTVATTLEKAKQLGASFFFSRGGGDIGTARIRTVTLGSNFTVRIFCQVQFCRCKISGLELVFSVVDLDIRAVYQLISVEPLHRN